MKLRVCWLIALLTSFFSSGSIAQKVVVGFDNLMPFHYIDKNLEPRGVIVDFARVWLEKHDVQFVVCPWARCIKLAEVGEIDILFGLSKTSETLIYFNFIEPQISDQSITYILIHGKDKKALESFDELNNSVVGILRGKDYNGALNRFNPKRLDQTISIESMVQKLELGRIDAVLIDEKLFKLLHSEKQWSNAVPSGLRIETSGKTYVVSSKLSKLDFDELTLSFQENHSDFLMVLEQLSLRELGL